MNFKKAPLVFFLGLFCAGALTLFADDAGVKQATLLMAHETVQGNLPVTTNASPEAAQLLQYIYSISGNHTLTGQHNAPLMDSIRLVLDQRATGQHPAVFGEDFGFDSPNTWDGINFRQRMVDEAIQRYREGYIIVLMWHAVRPIEDEPVTFKDSIQGKLTDQQWRDLITPGTEINERWKSQVDVIAWFLKQLREAHVPVLWRPYHEMNGAWFWWGQKPGDDGYKKLYRMLFDRLVNFHKLNNLIWIYGANEVDASKNIDPYDKYYPGDDVVDILATDIYRTGYAKEQHDQLLALAKSKPIALAEVGKAPSPAILKEQPRWTWFMLWGDPPGWGPDAETFKAAYKCDQVVTLEQLPWVQSGKTKINPPFTH
jgi:mannan endo-1,4-beta-mannosidase